MKHQIILIVLIFVFCFVSCHKPGEYIPHPPGLEQAVKDFFLQQGEHVGSFKGLQYSDDVLLIKASTKEAVGHGLIAEKKYLGGQSHWEINFASQDRLKALGIEPE